MSDDETMSELAARIASLDQRRAELSRDEQRLRDELIELYQRIEKLRGQPPEPAKPRLDHSALTTQCKACGRALTESAASASIFRLSFLPLYGKTIVRREATEYAERIGPLCQECLERRTDLADEGAK